MAARVTAPVPWLKQNFCAQQRYVAQQKEKREKRKKNEFLLHIIVEDRVLVVIQIQETFGIADAEILEM